MRLWRCSIYGLLFSAVLFLAAALRAQTFDPQAAWPEYAQNPFVIQLRQDPDQDKNDTAGGIALGELDGDGLLDYLFTTAESIGAYAHEGGALWVRQEPMRRGGASERVGLPGHFHPRCEAHDIDADGAAEVLFLRDDGELVWVDGRTGEVEGVLDPWKPREDGKDLIAGWETFTVCNLRGTGDFDIIFQATPLEGPGSRRGQMRGKVLAAFAWGDWAEPLWWTRRYWSPAHGPLRVADHDLDGRDEVVGITMIDDDGAIAPHWRYTDHWNLEEHGSFHLDALATGDVLPERPGLETVLLEEGANAVSLVGPTTFFWRKVYRRQEPQNAAVGDFSLEHPGLEIWCRSRRQRHQKPWVLSAAGDVIATWDMDEKSPDGWTTEGVEVIWAIDWDGGPLHYAAAKERHREGDICIFQPVTGEFIRTWQDHAARILVADVAGDSREEIIVQAGKALKVYWNQSENPYPPKPRYWTRNHYRRAKTNYNYYSP